MPKEKSRIAVVKRTQLPANVCYAKARARDDQRNEHHQVAHRADDRRLITTQQAGAMDGKVAGDLETEDESKDDQ
jgi:hypothetical protein